MRFDWDDQKNRTNRRKHGLDFEVAIAVFDDPLHVTTPDRVVDGELRWQTIGEIGTRYVVLVAHTLEEDGEEIVRIISARQATPHERREYEGDI